MWKELKTAETSEECCSFLDAVDIWINKPHVVNRCLCGAKILWQLSSHNYTTDSTEEQISKLVVDREEQENILILIAQVLGVSTPEIKINMRDLLPKSLDKHCILRELVIVDVTNLEAFFIAFALMNPTGYLVKVKDLRGYRIQLGKEKTSITLYVQGIQADDIQNQIGYTLPWLQDVLLSKIASWSVALQLNTAITSLQLVPIDRYNQLYQELKKKYGLPLVKVWPEKTDPQKFVYEDIAIATYLLLLWEDDRQRKGLTKKQSFVDLGCGNGLLVYILTLEGHQGLGLDLRKRRIWDFFGNKFNLQEQEILPSGETLFPEYDWLIGNHSDELTPWIPVIAARSSFQCCYFVLPCCPHDFSAKFNQKISGSSQYRAYLDFVQEVGTVCGFDVEEDTLRIPSTKRVCFIGRTRTYQQEDENEIDAKRTNYIEYRCSLASCKRPSHCNSLQCEKQTPVTDKSVTSCSEDCSTFEGTQCCEMSFKRKWAAGFEPRNSIQKLRNCVSVSSDIKDHITETVFSRLLSMESHQSFQLADGRHWNAGGSLALGDVACMFDQKILHQLKNECGGLQTLLRNSHHIFRVQGGLVKLRNWVTEDYDEHQRKKQHKKGKAMLANKDRQLKTKLCFFYDHHPQGCPLDSHICRFAHGLNELKSNIYKS